MSFDLQQQEQIDALKNFWDRWGKWAVGVVAGLAICYFGYRAYLYYQTQHTEKAALVYDELEKVARRGDLAKVKPLVSKLALEYPSTPYASRGALFAARVAFDKNDVAYTRTQLRWVLTHTAELAVKAVARLRLASVLLDQKDYRGAMTELTQEHDVAFDPLFLDLKGDVYAAQGDTAAARTAWTAAIAKVQRDALERQFIETKLDALGG